MKFTIKRFEETADPGPFVDAYLRLFNEAGNLKYVSFTGVPFTAGTVRSWVRRAGDQSVEYYTASGVDDGGHIAGIMVLRADRVAGLEIVGMVVEKRYRGVGIGSGLVETAIGKAEEYGFGAVDIAVYADNVEMLTLVIRHGFKPVGIDYHRRFDGEDVVRLKRTVPKNKYTMT